MLKQVVQKMCRLLFGTCAPHIKGFFLRVYCGLFIGVGGVHATMAVDGSEAFALISDVRSSNFKYGEKHKVALRPYIEPEATMTY